MNLIDLHCDTFTGLQTVKKDLDNDFSAINLTDIKNSHLTRYAQCFAAFISSDYKGEAAKEKWDSVYDWFKRQMQLYPEQIEQVKKAGDIRRITDAGKTAAILTTESAAAFTGKIESIKEMRDKGCLITSLTWNTTTELAGGVYNPEDGLTDFGKDAIEEMNRVGMIIDTAHLCDKSIDDLMKFTDVPFISTHSNARKMCNAFRNLTDEQIQEIIKRNGLIGMNFLIYFLNDQNPAEASIYDVLKHVEYILKMGGEDVLAIGSDYDGATIPKEIDSIGKIGALHLLLRNELGEELTEKIFYGNAYRFIEGFLKERK